MKFPRVTITQYTIADLPDVTVLHSLSTAELRRKIDILMIDDEEFTREDNLKRSGFHIIHKYEMF